MLGEARLTLAGILVVVIACTAGCSGRSDKAAHVETSTTGVIEATPAESSKAIQCLDAAGLSNVEEQHAGLWGGRHNGPTYTIVVHKLRKPAKAPRVVAGEYAVTGSFKVSAVGSGLIGDEGIQADALVQIVADCLSG